MGLALDTVLGEVTDSPSLAEITVANGNSTTVRAFNSPGSARLESIFLKGTGSPKVQIKSPLLHDDVRGIEYASSRSPAAFLMPPSVGQLLRSQDTLTVSATSGASGSTALAYTTYYSDYAGVNANLHDWGDISGMIEDVKPVYVSLTASATIGQYNDRKITTSEDLLKANRWYALLGYVVDTACLAVSFSGPDTGNLRVSGPGQTDTSDQTQYFISQSNHHGTPHIPVFNSANKDTTYVSVADNVASTAVGVYLTLALLSPTFGG